MSPEIRNIIEPVALLQILCSTIALNKLESGLIELIGFPVFLWYHIWPLGGVSLSKLNVFRSPILILRSHKVTDVSPEMLHRGLMKWFKTQNCPKQHLEGSDWLIVHHTFKCYWTPSFDFCLNLLPKRPSKKKITSLTKDQREHSSLIDGLLIWKSVACYSIALELILFVSST